MSTQAAARAAETAAIRAQISEYVAAYAQPIPETQKTRVADNADKKVRDIIKNYLQEAKKYSTTKKSRSFHSQFTSDTRLYVRESVISLFQTIFKSDYDITPQITDLGFMPFQEQDALLKSLSNVNTIPARSYKVALSWYDNNRHIYGATQETQRPYTPQDHLKKEWKAVRDGRGTDFTIREKGALPSGPKLQAHKAKLLMHSDTLFKERCGSFKEKAENSPELELDPAICTLKTFEYLLEFIYLGEISPDRKIDLQQLLKICSAAGYFGIDGMQEWCVDRLHVLVNEKKLSGDELGPFFDQALANGNDKLISFCFSHFSLSEIMQDVLICGITQRNWEKLYALAQPYSDVRELLEQMTKTNRDFLQFNPKRASAKPLVPTLTLAARKFRKCLTLNFF